MTRPARNPPEQELPEGARLLDRYTILDRIGSGGMATIYRATDNRLDRVVCIKLLRTTLVDGTADSSGRAVYKATYSHFLQEALALSRLQHPNTLRIYDFGYLNEGSEPGAPFHVSEYLDGGNLETHVRLRGVLSPAETLSMLEGITGAVAEAHEHGILHRDIKPSNIIFARVRGELVPKLADFGIATSDLKKRLPADVASSQGESVSTVALFSPRWAAPEQLCGSPEGPRTDVYALGLLTVFMLTGRMLFGDDDVRATFNDRVRGDTLVNARLAQLQLPPGVLRTLSHAVTARPDERIASAPEFFERMTGSLEIRPQTTTAVHHTATDPQNAVTPPMPAVIGAPPLPPAPPVPIEVESEPRTTLPPSTAPSERRVRIVHVHEKLDLSVPDADGGHVRVRVTMLPGATKLNVKGLTCFVVRPGQRPTPAVTVSHDGALELVSTASQTLGELAWSFGQPGPTGRLFVVNGQHVVVPYTDAIQAVALMLNRGPDIIVMCRR